MKTTTPRSSLTKAQRRGCWRVIRQIISSDATDQYSYQGDAPGQFCVLGGLGRAALIPLPKENTAFIDWCPSFATALCAAYPVLTPRRLRALQQINDAESHLVLRRASLLLRAQQFEQADLRRA